MGAAQLPNPQLNPQCNKLALSPMSTLMAIKVFGIIGLGIAFFWWQMRDLAQEKKRADERKSAQPDDAA